MDVQVTNHGTIILFRPLTDEASEWFGERIGDDAIWLGTALCVEHRYAPDIIEGLQCDGLQLT